MLLGGLDALIFTGGIGENIPEIRKQICGNIKCIGASINNLLNNSNIYDIISNIDSKFNILTLKSDEELLIAKKTHGLVND